MNRMGSRLVKKNGTTFSTEAYTYDHMNRITDVDLGSISNLYGYYWSGEWNRPSTVYRPTLLDRKAKTRTWIQVTTLIRGLTINLLRTRKWSPPRHRTTRFRTRLRGT